MQRTAIELREALVSRLAQGATLTLTDAEEARVTRRELRAAIFIDAAFGARVCPAASPSAPPPSTLPPSVLPSAPPVGVPPLPPPPPVAPPELHEAARVRVQLFDSFGDGWDGLQLVVSPLSGPASEASFHSLPRAEQHDGEPQPAARLPPAADDAPGRRAPHEHEHARRG